MFAFLIGFLVMVIGAFLLVVAVQVAYYLILGVIAIINGIFNGFE